MDMSNEGLKFIKDTFKHNFIRSYAFFFWGINGTNKVILAARRP